jgi:ATP-dependent Clp protease adaptor protein ClpS
MFNKEKYQEMLNDIINSTNNIESDTDSITELLEELGIKNSKSDIYNLVLWNDHVNNMMDVILALYEVCQIPSDDCVKFTMEAHNKGKCVIKSGSYDDMYKMKRGLNDRNLEATIENN